MDGTKRTAFGFSKTNLHNIAMYHRSDLVPRR
jgi:hypothetical protein